MHSIRLIRAAGLLFESEVCGQRWARGLTPCSIVAGAVATK